ncbi:MAG TPA: hypothetical protein VD859_13715 [Nocardioides sp.]|nr:hypothetical protein [Nocardioides sp.]
MAGQNIQRLLTAVAGMNREDVETSRTAWEKGSRSLERVVEKLMLAAPQVREGFGQHSDSGKASEQALIAVSDKVARRRQDMADAATALQLVLDAMDEAKDASGAMPTQAPGPAPRLDVPPGGDLQQEVTALKIHAAQTRQHNQQVTAYNDADAQAEQKMRRLNEAYQNAADALARIHGEPVSAPPPGQDAGGSGPGGGPVRPSGGPGPGAHQTIGSIEGNGGHGGNGHEGDGHGGSGNGTGDNGSGGDPTWPELPDGVIDPGTDAPEIGNPSLVTPDPAGGGSSLNGPVGGAGLAGLGILGGAGLRGILGGGATPVPAGGTPTRPIGGTTRTGASGTLGRGTAAAVPGQNAGRGTGGRAAAGRGTGARGTAGARGAAAPGAVAGRGKGARKDEERDPEKETYEVEDEWTDDEDQYPGVIGQ